MTVEIEQVLEQAKRALLDANRNGFTRGFKALESINDALAKLKNRTHLGWFVTLPDGNHTVALVDSERADFYKECEGCSLDPLFKLGEIDTPKQPSRSWDEVFFLDHLTKGDNCSICGFDDRGTGDSAHVCAGIMNKALEEAKRLGEAHKSVSETVLFERWFTKMVKEKHAFSDKDVEEFLRKGHNGNYIKYSTLHRFEGWLAGRNLK